MKSVGLRPRRFDPCCRRFWGCFGGTNDSFILFLVWLSYVSEHLNLIFSILSLKKNSLSQKEKEKRISKGPFGYSWKLKLKIKKYCSKIILICVNSTVGPIFNEKVVEKWNLWVHKQCIVHWLAEKNRKVKLCGYCSLNSAWTIAAVSQTRAKKKKKGKTPNAQSKLSLSLFIVFV